MVEYVQLKNPVQLKELQVRGISALGKTENSSTVCMNYINTINTRNNGEHWPIKTVPEQPEEKAEECICNSLKKPLFRNLTV